jgi:hypothetical protein
MAITAGPTAQIRMLHGVPTLFINGAAAPALAYMTFHLHDASLAAFARAGVELFTFTTTCDYDYYRLAASSWLGPDQYDYTQFDARMRQILQAAPRAKIFPRIYLCSPPWWDRAHPDQLMRGPDGVYAPQMDMGWLPANVRESSLAPEKATVPSLSSQLWLEQAGETLRRFVAHAEETFGDVTIGYHLCSGGSQEWYYWGAFENTLADTSAPHQAAFANWLRQTGKDASAAGGGGAGPIPSLDDRLASEFGVFRDPADPAARRVIDYWQFHAEALVAALRHFAAVTRGVIGPDKLIGAFYGYFIDLQRHATCWHNSGHLALQALLADPNVNFLTSPTAYKDRRVAAGFSLFNSLTESIAAHGKLWFNENDLLTDQSPKLKDKLFLHPQTALESRHLQRREFADSLCHSAGMWWFDMWSGYYDSAEKMGDVQRMVQIGARALQFDRGSASEVAVVLDDRSICYTQCANALTVPLIADQLMALGHLGTPFSMVHVDDLARLPAHKLYIFLDLFHLPPARLAAIHRTLARAAATALFVFAPGIADEDLALARMARLTGLQLAMERDAAVTRISLPPPIGSFGAMTPLGPVVHVVDPAAETLGLIDRTQRVGLAQKKVGAWTSLFSAAVNLPAALLRQLARTAGVHLYSPEGHTVYANRSFLSLCLAPDTPATLQLPADSALYDLFEKREIAVRNGVAEIPPSADGSHLFFRGSRKKWEGS